MDWKSSGHALKWECVCRVPPIVLARFDLDGNIAVEHIERFWTVDGRITTNCPSCGKQHRLELALSSEIANALPTAWTSGPPSR